MTNFERWLKYTEGLSSPDNYIQWGWLYLIAASLQRRVFLPPKHKPIYPNMFITLVGKPGIGKGEVIRAVSGVLKRYTLDEALRVREGYSEAEKEVMDGVQTREMEEAQKQLKAVDRKFVGKPLLIPIAADAITYEALVQQMAQSIRYINFKAFDEKQGKETMKVYGHSSLAFCLEEQASLFKNNKETKTTINFLLQAYDCGDTYEYRTKTAGNDRIIRVCLNFLAGTTPAFMEETFDEGILTEGFSSRTFYIFALRNRKTSFFRPDLTPEQEHYFKEICEHVRKLTSLYGQVYIDKDTEEFLNTWIHEDESHPESRSSKSPKLEAYYARKNLHIMKVAAALHFGENTDLHIPKDTFKEAIALLDKEEKTMHLALLMGGSNPTSKLANKIEVFLSKNGDKPFNDIYAQFFEHGKRSDIEEALEFLQSVGRIAHVSKTCPVTNQQLLYYNTKSR